MSTPFTRFTRSTFVLLLKKIERPEGKYILWKLLIAHIESWTAKALNSPWSTCSTQRKIVSIMVEIFRSIEIGRSKIKCLTSPPWKSEVWNDKADTHETAWSFTSLLSLSFRFAITRKPSGSFSTALWNRARNRATYLSVKRQPKNKVNKKRKNRKKWTKKNPPTTVPKKCPVSWRPNVLPLAWQLSPASTGLRQRDASLARRRGRWVRRRRQKQ